MVLKVVVNVAGALGREAAIRGAHQKVDRGALQDARHRLLPSRCQVARCVRSEAIRTCSSPTASARTTTTRVLDRRVLDRDECFGEWPLQYIPINNGLAVTKEIAVVGSFVGSNVLM
eukprot:2556054-Heterocapsa_arctica.AAC.1